MYKADATGWEVEDDSTGGFDELGGEKLGRREGGCSHSMYRRLS